MVDSDGGEDPEITTLQLEHLIGRGLELAMFIYFTDVTHFRSGGCKCGVVMLPYENNLPNMLPFAVFMIMLSLQRCAALLCGPGADALPKRVVHGAAIGEVG